MEHLGYECNIENVGQTVALAFVLSSNTLLIMTEFRFQPFKIVN